MRVNGEDYERIELNAGRRRRARAREAAVRRAARGATCSIRTRPQPRRLPVKADRARAVARPGRRGGLVAAVLHRGRAARSGQPWSRRPRRRRRRAPRPRRRRRRAAALRPPPAPPPRRPRRRRRAGRRQAGRRPPRTGRRRGPALGRIGPHVDDPAIRREATALGRRVETERQAALAVRQVRRGRQRQELRRGARPATSRSRPTASTSGARSPATKRRARCWSPST